MAADLVISMVQFLWSNPADLLVAATHEQDELASWLHNQLAEQLSRRSRIMTLLAECYKVAALDSYYKSA
ncbi:MAG: hypothetical protein A4C66_00065 [Nitrospira sp. HN-bin3]|nr:MAG: hypothetical protein A4C66_00065 [Nitrospira sp. HN-bin3]